MRISEAAQQLNLSTSTIRKYCNDGEIKTTKTPKGQRQISQEALQDFANKYNLTLPNQPQQEERKVFYIRSSSGNQDLLKAQQQELEQNYGTPTTTYTDRASGLNENRPALWRMLNSITPHNNTHIYITYKDRLTRFGYKYLEHIITTTGGKITVLHADKKYSAENELMNDFMTLIASFSGRFYRLRSYDNQKQLLTDAQKQLDKNKKAQQ